MATMRRVVASTSQELDGPAYASPAARRSMSSLKLRLIGISLAWVVISLLVTGVLLLVLFRAQVRRHFDQTLQDHLEELVGATEIEADGSLKLTWALADSRFRSPLSGWYWEMRRAGVSVKRSASLVDGMLAVPSPGVGRAHVFQNVPGPAGVRLRVLVQDIVFPETDQPITVLVAGPCATVQRDVFAFMGQLATALTVLGLTLGALIVAQVTYGLRPLTLMRTALAEVRSGRQLRLQADGPAEVAPLIDELNGLLDERAETVEQARAEAGDLAHALKTPIAVIRNEAHELPGGSGATIAAEADKMARVVEHHLVRSRTKAKQRIPGNRAHFGPVIQDVRFSLERLYPHRVLLFDIDPELVFAGEADDLGEMIGNLTDNACKWARQTVRVSAMRHEGRIGIRVDDDGPGLDDDACAQALARGERLGSRMPGHGLGLPIAAQLAELYGGSLRLQRSDLGGLSAFLDLPAASS